MSGIVQLLFPALLLSAPQLWSEKPKGAPVLATVPDFRDLVKESIGAVVNVSVEQTVRASRFHEGNGGDPNDFLQRFFGQRIPREFRNRGLGSGFVISADGYVLTNAHVVEGADSIKVKFPDDVSGDEFKAKVVGQDPNTDVALLKIDAKRSFPLLPLGNSSELFVGDWVMAIGNPFGLSHSVSAGIVSARDRRNIRPNDRQGLYDFIQTDASINPGNSGGPLLNMRGEVIGINAAINAAGQGLGFAIPINMVKNIIGELKEKGRVARSWIGIQIQPMDVKLAKSFGLDHAQGALVADIVPGGPAERSGIKKGDVVLEFDGKMVHDSSELPLLAAQGGVGRSLPLVLWREGKKQNVKITLGEMPGNVDGDAPTAGEAEPEKGGFGLRVQDVTPKMADRFELKVRSGVVVNEVEPGSPAEEAGLQPGDVIAELNGRPTTSARTFSQALRSAKSGDVLRLQVKRGDGSLYLAVTKP